MKAILLALKESRLYQGLQTKMGEKKLHAFFLLVCLMPI